MVPSERKSGRRVPGGGEAANLKGTAVVALLKPVLFRKAKAKEGKQVAAQDVLSPEVEGARWAQESILLVAAMVLRITAC